MGVPPQGCGEPVDTLMRLAVPVPRWQEGKLAGHVLHIDRFGNVVTSIRAEELASQLDVEVKIGGATVRGLVSAYAKANGLSALIGSHGYLEVALTNGGAARTLGVKVADEVEVRPN